ncbi:unnamed protein product, partial [Owenia fusiformis]
LMIRVPITDSIPSEHFDTVKGLIYTTVQAAISDTVVAGFDSLPLFNAVSVGYLAHEDCPDAAAGFKLKIAIDSCTLDNTVIPTLKTRLISSLCKGCRLSLELESCVDGATEVVIDVTVMAFEQKKANDVSISMQQDLRDNYFTIMSAFSLDLIFISPFGVSPTEKVITVYLKSTESCLGEAQLTAFQLALRTAVSTALPYSDVIDKCAGFCNIMSVSLGECSAAGDGSMIQLDLTIHGNVANEIAILETYFLETVFSTIVLPDLYSAFTLSLTADEVTDTVGQACTAKFVVDGAVGFTACQALSESVITTGVQTALSTICTGCSLTIEINISCAVSSSSATLSVTPAGGTIVGGCDAAIGAVTSLFTGLDIEVSPP